MFIFKTRIIEGEGRGARLGFPTINLDHSELRYEFGVYLGEATFSKRKYLCLIHFGPKKTFSDKVSLELYLEKYIEVNVKEEIEVKIIKRIRNIEKFETEKELKEQIARDKKFLKGK
jgi:riboflavin kinase/FMN adenylyltransferase